MLTKGRYDSYISISLLFMMGLFVFLRNYYLDFVFPTTQTAFRKQLPIWPEGRITILQTSRLDVYMEISGDHLIQHSLQGSQIRLSRVWSV